MGVDVSLIGVPAFDQLELVKTGSQPVDLTSVALNSSSTTTIAHNLGYTPILLAYLAAPGTSYKFPLPYIAFNDSTGHMIYQFYAWVDSTNVYFSFENFNNGLGSSYAYNYYLLRQRATTT